ncbi:acylphosphatase [Nitratiruptor sp. YY09-18]|uniref:acylphosphatase n=1 Tax=Nitratiruptor sp. YY09-18 TaxID=2724901 RepID=UPI001916861A|nr:acylphosphatase [Nitratiruptor sp. YY09-18]BCD68295.1 acylphosphatase [Nitratiruptor sp. YY09-18]
MKNCRCRVYGRVQGVWFRKFTQNIANELGVSGWVRNMPDGSVEIEASMPKNVWPKFYEAIKQGPPLARVDRIEVEDIDKSYSGGFEVVR